MRKAKSVLTLLCLALSVSAFAGSYSGKYEETINNFKNAEFAQPYFSSAYGYAVFPTIGKGGVVIGGAGGKGRVYQHGKLVGESTMVQVSVGFQLGGQAYSQIVFFRDKAAFDEFTRQGFEFTADASAVAITAGADAQAGTSGTSESASVTKEHGRTAGQYYKGMAVLTLAKGGLMYQAALAGQKYTFKQIG